MKIQQQVIIKPENISLAATSPTPTIEELFSQGYEHDPITKEIIQALKEGTKRHSKVSLSDCSIMGTQVYLRDRLLVPAYTPLKLKLIMEHHNEPSAGHPGVAKTLELIKRQYTWFGLRKDVKQYLSNCHICYRSKSSRHAPYGTLKSLPIPDQLWENITVDFVTVLPDCKGFNTIMMVADRLGKMRHLIVEAIGACGVQQQQRLLRSSVKW